MKGAIIGIFAVVGLTVACTAGVNQVEKSNTEVVVHYNGKEVSRKNTKYIGENELKHLLNRGEETIVIFGADWCSSCELARKAIKQSNLKIGVHWINIDEIWVQKLAKAMGINQVPLMFHVGSDDLTVAVRAGPGAIVSYLVVRY